MNVPKGYTEQQVLDAIEKAVAVLAHTFTFGYFDVDDIKQRGRLEALKFLDQHLHKYDAKRPFENFIYSHIRKRLINFKRDEYRRTDTPCKKCYAGHPCQPGKEHCQPFAKWWKRNKDKSQIMRPKVLHDIPDESESRLRLSSLASESLVYQEMIQTIDMNLPVEYRASWNKLLEGSPLSRNKKAKVQAVVAEILAGAGVGEEHAA